MYTDDWIALNREANNPIYFNEMDKIVEDKMIRSDYALIRTMAVAGAKACYWVTQVVPQKIINDIKWMSKSGAPSEAIEVHALDQLIRHMCPESIDHWQNWNTYGLSRNKMTKKYLDLRENLHVPPSAAYQISVGLQLAHMSHPNKDPYMQASPQGFYWHLPPDIPFKHYNNFIVLSYDCQENLMDFFGLDERYSREKIVMSELLGLVKSLDRNCLKFFKSAGLEKEYPRLHGTAKGLDVHDWVHILQTMWRGTHGQVAWCLPKKNKGIEILLPPAWENACQTN